MLAWDKYRRLYRSTAPWIYEPMNSWLAMLAEDELSMEGRPFLACSSAVFRAVKSAFTVRPLSVLCPCCVRVCFVPF
jgi:hypothetical protein